MIPDVHPTPTLPRGSVERRYSNLHHRRIVLNKRAGLPCQVQENFSEHPSPHLPSRSIGKGDGARFVSTPHHHITTRWEKPSRGNDLRGTQRIEQPPATRGKRLSKIAGTRATACEDPD